MPGSINKQVGSKVGSLENISHKPSGGSKKIFSEKVDFKAKASSKIGSLENISHKPKGGNKRVETHKLEFKAEAKVGSLENLKHKPAGGDKKIPTQKLNFKETAKPKIGSLDNVRASSANSSQSRIHAKNSGQ